MNRKIKDFHYWLKKEGYILIVATLIALIIVSVLGYISYWIFSLTGWHYKIVGIIFGLITIGIAYVLYAFIKWGWEQIQ